MRFLAANGRPLVLGHRGASAAFPENTLLAFREAMRAGADGVELDAMRCGSGEVVVVHDDNLERVTAGEGGGEGSLRAPRAQRRAAPRALLVRQTPLATLREFDLGQGERLPTLAEVLEELGPTALVNVELKSPEVKGGREHLGLLRDDGLAEATAAVLRRAGRVHGGGTSREHRDSGTTLVSSFDPMQLLRFRQHSRAQVPIGYLFHGQLARPLREAWLAPILRPAALHPDAALVDAVSVRRWRKGGYAIHVWTVDDPREVAALAALGVDGIITNTPGAVRRLLAPGSA